MNLYHNLGPKKFEKYIFFSLLVRGINSSFAPGGFRYLYIGRERFWIFWPYSNPMTMSRGRNIGLPLMNLLRLKGAPILQQLHLEEQLLRTSTENWCILNDGTNIPTIVMGMAGKPYELLELEDVIADHVPVVRRFTGGGTVIVDNGTIFATFICNKDDAPGVQPYPRPIMYWTSLLYKEVFQRNDDFHLRENDYVFGNYKFGGNAQSITKNRWVHHTSFLWDYDAQNMAYLKLPMRAPEYRSARGHTEFICRMKDYLPRSEFIEKTVTSVGRHFSLKPIGLEAVEASLTAFTHSTKLLSKKELVEALGFDPGDRLRLLL